MAATSATWPTGRSIRAALTVGGPLLVGAALDHALVGMWIGMGTLLLSAGERSVAYAARFRQFAVTTPLAAGAYFLGFLSSAPPVLTVIVMAVLAFVAGIASGYSGAVSVGTMQAMLIAAIAIGVPAAAPYWKPAVLFVTGAAISALCLAAEVAFDRRRPQRAALAAALDALAALADTRRVEGADFVATRATAIAAIDLYDSMAIAARGMANGPTPDYDRASTVVRTADQLLARLIADDVDSDLCARTAARLGDCARAVRHGHRLPTLDVEGQTLIRLRMLESALWDDMPSVRSPRSADRSWLGPPGSALITSAMQLSLCTALAYAAYYILPVPHGYWIALTVALVMKPDLGSVFSRAVLRCIGTVAGAIIAVAVGLIVDGAVATAVLVGFLAACLPWAMTRSYLWQAVFLTPLIMLLIDMVVPHESILEISEARVATTFIGGVIVLVAGYLIWPSMRHPRVARQFGAALDLLGAYATSVASGADPQTVAAARRSTYRALADTRVHLQRTLSEPPPAGADAWAWIPVVAGAERVADRVTAVSASRGAISVQTLSDLRSVADDLHSLSEGVAPGHNADTRVPHPPTHGGESTDAVIRELADELAQLSSMLTHRT